MREQLQQQQQKKEYKGFSNNSDYIFVLLGLKDQLENFVNFSKRSGEGGVGILKNVNNSVQRTKTQGNFDAYRLLKAKKGERIGLNKANSFVFRLSVSYVQKEKKWFRTLQTRNINKRGRVPISSKRSGKNRKINKLLLRLLDAYEYSSLFKTEINNHKWES